MVSENIPREPVGHYEVYHQIPHSSILLSSVQIWRLKRQKIVTVCTLHPMSSSKPSWLSGDCQHQRVYFDDDHVAHGPLMIMTRLYVILSFSSILLALCHSSTARRIVLLVDCRRSFKQKYECLIDKCKHNAEHWFYYTCLALAILVCFLKAFHATSLS